MADWGTNRTPDTSDQLEPTGDWSGGTDIEINDCASRAYISVNNNNPKITNKSEKLVEKCRLLAWAHRTAQLPLTFGSANRNRLARIHSTYFSQTNTKSNLRYQELAFQCCQTNLFVNYASFAYGQLSISNHAPVQPLLLSFSSFFVWEFEHFETGMCWLWVTQLKTPA